tara:strand:- start:2320 stop:3378 length:1059 start_codon:yes stop_codon:yes gene_type:complete
MNTERTGPLRKASGGKTKKKMPTGPKPRPTERERAKKKRTSTLGGQIDEIMNPGGRAARTKRGEGYRSVPSLTEIMRGTYRYGKDKVTDMMTDMASPMKKGGKLKMVEKNGKKVPFYAADGVGKMNKGGSVKVGQKGAAKTLSQIAKQNNTSIQALLAANPSIKNANQIRMGQTIKLPKAGSVPGNTKTKNPYARMSQTQMNMIRSKNKRTQRAGTDAIRNEVKRSGAQTSPTPKKAKAVKDSRSAVPEAKKKELVAKMKAEQSKKPKKKSLLSRLLGKKAGGVMKRGKPKMAGPRAPMTAAQKKAEYQRRLKKQKLAMTAGKPKKVPGYKSGGTVRGAGAATKGKRFGRAG